MYLDTSSQVADERITLRHSVGGRVGHDLVESIFVQELRNPLL